MTSGDENCCTGFFFYSSLNGQVKELTVTLHALVDESVQQRAAVVTEGRTPVGVDLEFMLCSGILKEPAGGKNKQSQNNTDSRLSHEH